MEARFGNQNWSKTGLVLGGSNSGKIQGLAFGGRRGGFHGFARRGAAFGPKQQQVEDVKRCGSEARFAPPNETTRFKKWVLAMPLRHV